MPTPATHTYDGYSSALRKGILAALQAEVSHCNTHSQNASYENTRFLNEQMKRLHAAIDDLNTGAAVSITFNLAKD